MSSVRAARTAKLAGALTAALAIVACGSESNPSAPEMVGSPNGTDAGEDAPTVELGEGLTTFRVLSGDAADPVELVMGPQGGWHIDLAVKVRGFEPGDLTLTYSATTAARTFGLVEYRVIAGRKFVRSNDGWERSGDRVIFDIQAPSDVVGQTLDASVTLDAAGVRLADVRRITIVDTDP